MPTPVNMILHKKGLFVIIAFFLQLNGSIIAQKTIPENFIGHWEGAVDMIGRTMHVTFDLHPDKCTYDLIEMGIYFSRVENYTISKAGSFSIEIPGNPQLLLKGKIKDDVMDGWADGKLRMNFSLKKTSALPAFLREEEVQYSSGHTILSGTLIRPNGDGPFPAVVLLSGSAAQGNMTRERTRNMGYFFAKNGVAALIYDRRGNGKSQGEPDKIIPMKLLAEDAAAAAEFLYSRSGIDKNKIGFYGLSQGGWVAPYASSLFRNTAFTIVVSAPGITPDEQNRFASRNMVAGIVSKHLKEAGAPDRSFDFAGYEKDKDNLKTQKETIPGFSFFDPVPYWSRITFPVLALYGSDDKIVPVEKSKTLIEAALKKAGNENYVFKIVGAADHQLRQKLNDYPPVIVNAKGVDEILVEWIKKNLF